MRWVVQPYLGKNSWVIISSTSSTLENYFSKSKPVKQLLLYIRRVYSSLRLGHQSSYALLVWISLSPIRCTIKYYMVEDGSVKWNSLFGVVSLENINRSEVTDKISKHFRSRPSLIAGTLNCYTCIITRSCRHSVDHQWGQWRIRKGCKDFNLSRLIRFTLSIMVFKRKVKFSASF